MLAEGLLTELYLEDCIRPAPALRVEGRKTIDQMVSLFEESAWTLLWRAEYAQLDGDLQSAKQLVDMALDRLEKAESPYGRAFLQAGMILASTPGEEERGRRLLIEATESDEPDSWGHVLYALLVEGEDPECASEHLRIAEEHWKGEEGKFDQEVQKARAMYELNVRRLRSPETTSGTSLR